MMGTPQCHQFNCMELTKDRFPRLRTNKVDLISVLGLHGCRLTVV